MLFFRFILFAAVIYILAKWLRKSSPTQKKKQSFDQPEQTIEEMVQDPVCGMWVPVSQALPLVRGRETLYFCCTACRDKFQRT
jgi:uncharacterized protein